MFKYDHALCFIGNLGEKDLDDKINGKKKIEKNESSSFLKEK